MKKRPNILYVFPDQFTPKGFGMLQEFPVQTPNLDEFITDSLMVENAISNNPICSPYRAMLMSGKYPEKTGVITNCNHPRNAYGVFLKQKERCITDIYHDLGYSVGYIGKWHLDPPEPSYAEFTEGYRDGVLWDSFTPPSRRHSVDYWYSYGAMDNHMHPHYWANESDVSSSVKVDTWSVEHETDKAIDYINNKDMVREEDKPFMLFVAYNPPHPPYDRVPNKYAEKYRKMPISTLLKSPNFMTHNPVELSDKVDTKGGEAAINSVANYLGAIEGIDDNFGRLIQCLKEKGLYDDTIIVFTSDHGDLMGSHNKIGKSSWYAESLKVPFVIRYPSLIKKGKTDCILNVPDILPTLMSLSGRKDAIPQDIDGKDKSKALNREIEDEDSAIYFEYFTNARGLKTKEYTYISFKNWAGDLVMEFLYDDLKDPYQLKEISCENKELCKQLSKKLEAKLIEIGESRR